MLLKRLLIYFFMAVSVLVYSCSSNTQYGYIVCGHSSLKKEYSYDTKIECLAFLPWNQTESIEPPKIVEGIDSTVSKIVYPKIAKRAGISGIVLSEFIVTTDGKAAEIKIIKGIGAGCDEVIISLLKQTKFSPAQKDGEKIDQLMRFTVKFNLDVKELDTEYKSYNNDPD